MTTVYTSYNHQGLAAQTHGVRHTEGSLLGLITGAKIALTWGGKVDGSCNPYLPTTGHTSQARWC